MKKSKTAQHLALWDQTFSYAIAAGIIHRYAEDDHLQGRTITLDDKEMVNFGSCSYLGLEQDERLKAGAMDAIRRYGVQFSSSRAYLSIKLYKDLEEELEKIFQGSVMISPSVTMGHLSAIPVLVEDEDAVILDHQVHASVQMTIQLLRARSIRVEQIRHNRMDMLESRIKKLQKDHKRIWFFADSVYSMFGDYVPFEDLKSLMDKYPALHLYIDDAHGIGWFGRKGQGVASTFMGGHEKVYIAASLNKSFAAGGGALIFPNKKIHERVRKTGSTITFSGPIQPPSLGAAMASAKLHQSSELPLLQEELKRRVNCFNREAAIKGLEQPIPSDTPIGFIRIGDTEATFEIVQRLMKRGFFVNTAAYPSVPYKEAGIRITLHNHLEESDIVDLVSCLDLEIKAVLEEMEVERESVIQLSRGE